MRYEIGDLAWTAQSIDPPAQPQQDLATLIGDPRLKLLINQALENNPDIGIASARVERARAELVGIRSQSLPNVTADAGIGREFSRASGKTLDFGVKSLRLDASWNPDLFGRVRAKGDAGRSRSAAATWELQVVRQMVEAEVARAWVQRATLKRRLQIYDAVIARSEEMERIVRVRQRAGAATRVELGLQSIRVLELRERQKTLERNLDQTRTTLARLTGSPAPGFQAEDPLPSDLKIPDIALPAPRILLANRPDISAAEELINAADGDARAARAAFFPSFNLSFVGMIEALTGQPSTQSLSLGSSLLTPIFNRGSLKRDLAVARADQLEAAETFRKTVLAALVEVEDLMRERSLNQDRRTIIDKITAESQLTATLGKAQYLEGEEDLRTLIDAEELRSDAEEAGVLLWQEQMLTQIGLYQAIGKR
ncbi:TolC family protein [Novosphingobium aquae]|uniref:TolC family protein n=1 Tax=Novosphingobium aquae TaxID=3133435 RepID=A0ABU8SC44_9SPHN